MPTARSISLVRNGKPTFCLEVVPSQDAETIFEAISELLLHMEKCVQEKIRWYVRGSSDAPATRLVLNFCPGRELGPEAFEISAGHSRVTLAASTVQAMNHGVHFLLEQAFGVRWLWPGATGTVTPRARNVRWPVGTQRFSPDWLWRRLWFGGAFWQEDDPLLAEMKYGGISPATLEELHRWQRRNRLGGLNIADGHRWAQICSPLEYGESHPEYFALVGGKRDAVFCNGKHHNQPCTSNPDVVELTAKSVMEQFRMRPELDGFSISLNDGSRFCECERCRALDAGGAGSDGDARLDARTEEHRAPGTAGGNFTPVTDRMLHFANQVAGRVAVEFPKKLLLFLIYSHYRRPPRRVKLHPNVIAQFCTMTWAHTDPAVHRAEMDTLRQFAPVASRRGIYDYFVNGTNGALPRGFARPLLRSLRAYHEAGCRYFTAQCGLDFASNGFLYYAAARQLWDRRMDVEVLLEDYTRSAFGPAARTMCRYLAAFLDRWEEMRGANGAVEQDTLRLYPVSWRDDRREELQQARSEAASVPDALTRIQFVAEGLKFLDLFHDACAAALALFPAEQINYRQRTEDELLRWVRCPTRRRALVKAVRTRSQLLRWVEEHGNGFLTAAMWFQYQRISRKGLLGPAMDLAADALRRLNGKHK